MDYNDGSNEREREFYNYVWIDKFYVMILGVGVDYNDR